MRKSLPNRVDERLTSPYRDSMRMILNNKPLLWMLLTIPAIVMVQRLFGGTREAVDLLHPTGEWSARLMIIAMALAPLQSLIGNGRVLSWLIARRRTFGVAAFGYAMLHLLFYIIDMGTVKDMLAELPAPGIWTGWLALAFMAVPAITSNDAAMRGLKLGWKRLQRFVYPAAILTLLHWIWVHNDFAVALAHFIPLGLLLAARWIKSLSPQVLKGT
jgi:methionine sulfoxide reductase heme-binding subunit